MSDIKILRYVDVINSCLEYLDEEYIDIRTSLMTFKLLIDGIDEDRYQQVDKYPFINNIDRIENNIYHNDYLNYQLNNELIELAKGFLNKVDEDIKKKTFKEYFNGYLKFIIKYINKLQEWIIVSNGIRLHYLNDIQPNKDNSNRQNITFLSYAFDDNIFAYYLYMLFKRNNGFLYVDSFMNVPHKYGKDIKKTIYPWIIDADQFLFLKSSVSDSSQIRQWCAWEIGVAYSNNKLKGNCYYVSIEHKNKGKSSLLDDFKPMIGVSNGIIH